MLTLISQEVKGRILFAALVVLASVLPAKSETLPAGVSGSVQFNRGVFGSTASFRFDLSSQTLAVPGILATSMTVTQSLIISSMSVSGVTLLGGSTTIKGTATNNNAALGFVGEYKESADAGTVNMTNNTYQDYQSLSLTAGDWDVQGTVDFFMNSASGIQTIIAGLSTTSGNSGTGITVGLTCVREEGGAGTIAMNSAQYRDYTTPMVRFSLSGTTTIYLKTYTSRSGSGTIQAIHGYMRARRVR